MACQGQNQHRYGMDILWYQANSNRSDNDPYIGGDNTANGARITTAVRGRDSLACVRGEQQPKRWGGPTERSGGHSRGPLRIALREPPDRRLRVGVGVQRADALLEHEALAEDAFPA